MPEWWTYTLSDFLLFSPRAYYRLIERHNAALWPAHLATIGLGLVTVGLLLRPPAGQGRIVSGVVAVLWAWVGWAFFWGRYATINWAATYLAWLFWIEALVLLWFGVARGGLTYRLRRDAAGVLGTGLLVTSLLVYPLLAPLLGRGWGQAEAFGIVPDPTAAATVGLLLLAAGAPRGILLAAPVLWCAVSAATLLAMGSPDAWVPLAAALLPLAASATRGRRAP